MEAADLIAGQEPSWASNRPSHADSWYESWVEGVIEDD
jgi:hypothetical protein